MVWLSRGLFVVLVGVLIYGAWQLVQLILEFKRPARLVDLGLDAYGRSAACAGRRRRRHALDRSRPDWLSACRRGCRGMLQPVVQVLASFPSPLLFPLVILGLQTAA